jgi:hypothetical protein
VGGIGARALRRQVVGLLPTLHAGGAIRVGGYRMGQDQGERLVQAVGQDLDAEYGTSLLAHLRDGVVPALTGRAVARGEWPCGSGLVAEALGKQCDERLAGSRGVWYSGHNTLSRMEGLRGTCGATVPE